MPQTVGSGISLYGVHVAKELGYGVYVVCRMVTNQQFVFIDEFDRRANELMELLLRNGQDFTDDRQFARRFADMAARKELLLRPMGNTVYFMTPYIISGSEIDLLASRTLELLEQLS